MNLGIEPLADESAVIIDLTSLIDVLFVLLLFFMVTTTFSDTTSIPVELPTAQSGTPQNNSQELLISVTDKGQIFLDDKSLTKQQLLSEFVRRKAEAKDINVVLRADKAAQHGIVVGILDDAKTSGIDNIAIATTSK